MNVLQKLQLARIKLQGMKLEKTGKNDFAGYEYFELGDFLPAAQTIFCDVGLCGIVSYSLDGCSLTIYNTEDPNEKLVFMSPWAEANLKGCHPIQNLGAAETYQRRYLWVTALEIVEHDALEDATTGSEEGKRAYTPREDMVMTNRLVPKAYWDATDQIVKDKLLGGAGNSVKKVDKQWFIMEPKKKVETEEDNPLRLVDVDNPLRLATEHRPLPTATGPTRKFYRPGQPELPAVPPATEGYTTWEKQRVIKVIEKPTASGTKYWEIVTGDTTCFCRNEKLVEELKMMDGEEVVLVVQESVRRKGSYELMDFEGALA